MEESELNDFRERMKSLKDGFERLIGEEFGPDSNFSFLLLFHEKNEKGVLKMFGEENDEMEFRTFLSRQRAYSNETRRFADVSNLDSFKVINIEPIGVLKTDNLLTVKKQIFDKENQLLKFELKEVDGIWDSRMFDLTDMTMLN